MRTVVSASAGIGLIDTLHQVANGIASCHEQTAVYVGLRGNGIALSVIGLLLQTHHQENNQRDGQDDNEQRNARYDQNLENPH